MAKEKSKTKAGERKVIGYLRVSTGNQDLESQKLGILDFLNAQGWKAQLVEEHISGTVPYEKRDLKNVVDSLTKGDVLVVSELSRLGRSMLEIMTLLCQLSERGIKVYAVKGNHSLDGSLQSKIISMVLCMAAEIERELISQRTKEALALRKRQGVKLGRPKGPGKSKLDAKIDEIRALKAKGISVASLAKIFDASWPTMKNFLNKKLGEK